MLSHDNPYFQQVALLVESLPLVAREPCFALKGGTAINLFVRDLPRLSVDIDLAYLPVQDRPTSLAEIGAALERIAAAIEHAFRGAVVQRITAEGSLVKLFVRRGSARIKIEVSPVLRGCVREHVALELCPALQEEFGTVEAPVLHLDDLYAGKLCAALDRQHPRDLFDVRQLLAAEGINEDLIEVLIVYLLSGDRPLAELLRPNRQPLEAVFEAEFRGMTIQSTSVSELEQTREAMIARIHEMLSDRHRDFLLGFKRGEPDWKLLKLPGVEHLPAVQWKLLNVRRMTRARREAAIENLRRALYA